MDDEEGTQPRMPSALSVWLRRTGIPVAALTAVAWSLLTLVTIFFLGWQ